MIYASDNMKIMLAIDIMDGKVVRLYKGVPNKAKVYSNDPLAVAKELEPYADVLHIIDLDAAFGKGNNKNIIKRIADDTSIKVQVGGGIRSIDYAKELLCYVDYIMLGTLAFKDEEALVELLKDYKDRIIVAIDYKDNMVRIKGWKESSNISIKEAISHLKGLGVSKFLLTSIDRDGTLEGPDIDTLKGIADMADIIASGGIASIDDVIALSRLDLYGVIIGRALYENRIDLARLRMIQ